jgi:hypothetical protein
MPWTNKTQTRIDIIAALGLPLTAPRWHEWVTRAQDSVENYGGDGAIAQIEDYVSKYQAASTAFNGAAANGNIKKLGIADGIEYFDGGANDGYKTEMNRQRNNLLDALFWEGEKAEIRRISSDFAKRTVRVGR